MSCCHLELGELDDIMIVLVETVSEGSGLVVVFRTLARLARHCLVTNQQQYGQCFSLLPIPIAKPCRCVDHQGVVSIARCFR